MLFAPPLPPLPLPGQATVVIGRSRECDLRLADTDTSRRHAKIVCEAGRFVLHDLASTNGTFVNGQRIEQRALEPGDRIQVGANLVTFCQVNVDGDAEGDPDDDGRRTRIFETRAAGEPSEVFRGDLAEIPPFAVLQVLEMGRKTGRLEIDSDGEPGSLWLRNGEPIHAETKQRIGFDAAIALVRATLGRFAFEPDAALPDATIDASVTDLLLEASRRLDEGIG
jgi:hypothetical protein